MDPCLVDDGSWTDEKHMHFLDFLETSFLHAMFEASGTNEGDYVHLDRKLPDGCDSTWDSRPRIPRRRKAHLSKGMRRPKKSKRSSSMSSHHDPSNDQVVPQLARKWGGEGDYMEEEDHGQKRRKCLAQTQ
ncbi:hypothetical protein MLD38_008977 [Melastoma candidum]|uniref:Uncharacterized protein n=1 Tax=Melastoma candidum TaxID=119954 RepID=A0ACB9RW13_9MYRT|nr:hypothetical protein MLD38_008977 [Melastoma candidum]